MQKGIKKKKKKRNEAYSESINSAPPLLIRLPVTRVEATLARCNYNHDENPVCKTYFHPKSFVCSTSVINLRIFFLLNVNCKPIRVLLWDTRGFQTIRRTVRTVFQEIPMSNHHWVSFWRRPKPAKREYIYSAYKMCYTINLLTIKTERLQRNILIEKLVYKTIDRRIV